MKRSVNDEKNEPPFHSHADGVRLAVRLTPRAGRSACAGIVEDANGRPSLHIKVAAPPVDGEANAALIAFLARALSLRKSDITIASGATGRSKILQIAGDAPALMARLSEWLAH